MFELILLNLFFSIISVLPNWDLEKSSRELLTNNTYTYPITNREMYGLKAKLEKTITRSDSGAITHTNKLCIDESSCSTVTFENIESFYKFGESRKLLCPMGKFDPINLDGTESDRSKLTEGFIHKLKSRFNNIEIIKIDERFTTVEAHRTMNDLNIDSRKKKDIVDTISAVYILESYLKTIEK